MANSGIKGITIEIGGDTTPLQNALKDVEKTAQGFANELKSIDKLLKLDPTNINLLTQKQEALGKQIEATKEKLERLKSAQDQVNEAFENKQIGEQQYRAFQREVEATEIQLRKLEEQSKETGDKLSGTGDDAQTAGNQIEEAGKQSEKAGEDAEKSHEGWKKLGDALVEIGKVALEALAAATAAIADFAKESVQIGMEFDSAMSKVGAVSGATGEDLDALRDKAREMGATTQFSATEAAEAMNYMAMAGWKTEDMLDGISGIMNLAAASGEDLATTSDIVTDALTAFGLKAEDSAHFADILAAASSNANTNVSMMGETFKYAAPVAGAFGYSAEDVAEAIGLMANSGIKASSAGTALRKILTELNGEIEIQGDNLGKVVIQTSNADGSMRDLNDILDDCRGAFSQLSESEAASAAKALVGQNAMSGFLALMNAAPEDIDKLRTSLDNCSETMVKTKDGSVIPLTEALESGVEIVEEYNGAAEEMARKMNDNLAGDIKIFQSAVQEAQITISDKLTPALREFVQFGTTAVQDLTNAFNENGLSGAMEELGNILTDGLSMIIDMVPSFIDAGASLLGALVSGICDNIPNLLDAAIETITSFADYLIQNLPEIVPAAVHTVLEFAEKLTDPDTLLPLVDSALDLVLALVEGIIDSLPELIEKAPEIVINLAEAIIRAVPRILVAGVKLIESLIEGIMSAFGLLDEAGNGITERLAEAWENIKLDWADAGEWFAQKWEEIKESLTLANIVEFYKQKFEETAEAVKNVWENMPGWFERKKEDIQRAFESIDTWFGDKFGAAWEAIKLPFEEAERFFQMIWDQIQRIFQVVKDVLAGDFDAAWEGIKEIWDNAVGYYEDVWENIKRVFSDLEDWFKEKFQDAWEAVKEVWDVMPDWFHEKWEDIKNFKLSDIPDWFEEKFGKAHDLVTGIWEGAPDWFGDIWNGIKNWFESADEWFGDKFGAAWDAVMLPWKAAVDFFDEIWQGISGTFSVVKEVLSGDFSDAWDSIKAVWQSVPDFFRQIWDSIKNVFSGAPGWFSQIFNDTVNNIRNIFSGLISSAASWGSDLVNSFMSGIQSMWGSFTSTLSSLAGTVTSYLGFSEPEEGPLSNFHTYAPDMMELFIKGIRDNEGKLKKTISETFDFRLPDKFSEMQTKLTAAERKLAYDTTGSSVTNNNTTSLGGISVVITGSVGSMAEAADIGNEIAQKIQRNLRYKGVTAYV